MTNPYQAPRSDIDVDMQRRPRNVVLAVALLMFDLVLGLLDVIVMDPEGAQLLSSGVGIISVAIVVAIVALPVSLILMRIGWGRYVAIVMYVLFAVVGLADPEPYPALLPPVVYFTLETIAIALTFTRSANAWFAGTR